MWLMIEAPTNCWWYEMHIAGMVGKTISVNGKPHKVVYATCVADDELFKRAHVMRLELEEST